jgi:hypothetical protein
VSVRDRKLLIRTDRGACPGTTLTPPLGVLRPADEGDGQVGDRDGEGDQGGCHLLRAVSGPPVGDQRAEQQQGQRSCGANVRWVAARAKPASSETGEHKTPGLGAHPAREHSIAAGKAARQLAPLESHRDFAAAASRDPIGLLLGQATALSQILARPAGRVASPAWLRPLSQQPPSGPLAGVTHHPHARP